MSDSVLVFATFKIKVLEREFVSIKDTFGLHILLILNKQLTEYGQLDF